MENTKTSGKTISSSGEISKHGNTKKTKEHTNPTFDKRGIQKAKQCWRRFPQYVIMTPNIDFNEMTLDPEIIQQNREDLKHRIKDLIIWALGKAAITEMTRTVGENDQTRRDINHLYSLFRMHFIQERNKFHSHAVFVTREQNETAEDVRTKILQVRRSCEFENVTPTELIALKF